jgi:hypothetical protein
MDYLPTNNATKRTHECERELCDHEPMNRNKYIWNILMMGQNILRISPCQVGMMWEIFFHMYMDESH